MRKFVFWLGNLFRVKRLNKCMSKVWFEVCEVDSSELGSEEECMEVMNIIKSRGFKYRLLVYYWNYNEWFMNKIYKMFWSYMMK